VDSPEPKRSFWLRVPPPLVFATCFVAGLQLDWLIAPSAPPESLAPAAWALGVTLCTVAGLLSVPAILLLVRRRTTVVPHGRSTALVTAGPYRVSRNPMYLGLATVYVGLALVLSSLWPLLLLPLPIWLLNTRVIPMEERALSEAFGDEYRAYQRRVRRWIGR